MVNLLKLITDIMFHKEFYPTPIEVLQLMDIDCVNKVCYEPHAGKGDVHN